MSSKRNSVQTYIEKKLGCNDPLCWSSYKSKLETYVLNAEDEEKLDDLSFSDSVSYYLKALISFCEALQGIKRSRSSWAVVKLYYSLFYLIRSDILLEGYILVRCKSLYYIKLKADETLHKFQKNNVRGDHQLTMFFYNKLHTERKNIDPIQDGKIDDHIPYLWMMVQRERVNYRKKDFSEPKIVKCLEKPFSYIKDGKEEDLLRMYLSSNDYIYCFDQEHACLAIPYIKMLQIAEKIHNNDKPISISRELANHIKSIGYEGSQHLIQVITTA